MYDPNRKLPKVGENVLLVVQLRNQKEVHEGHLCKDGQWYLEPYGRHTWDNWNIVGWMPIPQDDFTSNFLSFGLGFAAGITMILSVLVFMGG